MHVIDDLVRIFASFPGLGPKSARRIVVHLLYNKNRFIPDLLQELTKVQTSLGYCTYCNNLTYDPICVICSQPDRNKQQLCIVESALDLLTLEKNGVYKGMYFILGGILSPINGFRAENLPMEQLKRVIHEWGVRDITFALISSIEGQTTCYYLKEQLKDQSLNYFTLARGIPEGGAIEYLDEVTIASALMNKQKFD